MGDDWCGCGRVWRSWRASGKDFGKDWIQASGQYVATAYYCERVKAAAPIDPGRCLSDDAVATTESPEWYYSTDQNGQSSVIAVNAECWMLMPMLMLNPR